MTTPAQSAAQSSAVFPSGPSQQVIEIPTNAKAEVIASLRWRHESLFTARLPIESPTPPRRLNRSPLEARPQSSNRKRRRVRPSATNAKERPTIQQKSFERQPKIYHDSEKDNACLFWRSIPRFDSHVACSSPARGLEALPRADHRLVPQFQHLAGITISLCRKSAFR
jgi:hypothetical protein